MRLAVLVLLAAVAAPAGAEEPAPAPPPADPFWTEAELDLLDRGLLVVNASRADLGFQKRPLEDPFRLEVVNRALDDPLSVGREAQAWDEAAGGGVPDDLLRRSYIALDSRLVSDWNKFSGFAESVDEGLESRVGGATESLRRVCLVVRLAREGVPSSLAAIQEQTEPLLTAMFRSQVEKPATADPVPGLADDEMLRLGTVLDEAEREEKGGSRRECLARLVVRGLQEDVPRLRQACSGPATPWTGRRTSETNRGIVLYGYGDDVHDAKADEDAVLVIDLGGNDTWTRGASASVPKNRPVSVCIDLAGNDRYAGREDLSFGAALGGIAVQWDCAGDDLYDAGHASLGAGICGVGVLVDEGGDDVYRCRDFGIGAGAFGIGILLDKGGNDLYHADLRGQGFASTRGVGVLADLDGHDVYDAGGAHVHAPLYNDRTQSLSQGFSIGMRPDASGGVGVLIDRRGNDRYAADIYGQGAAYWYGLGVLVDSDGNDTYNLGQYGQGSGIHLAAGILVDRAGSDLYYLKNGVGMGGAHDYSVGMLVDRGGDDYYAGSGGTQGGALTNSVALLFDMAGKDSYAVAGVGGAQGAATPARGTGGIGLLLDAGGADLYSETTRDGAAWAREWVGAGLDEPAPPAAEGVGDPGRTALTPEEAKEAVDRDGTVEGADGARADDLGRLWEMACRWEVGDNRVIVPLARERLLALGAAARDRALERVGTKDGLEFRAVEWTLGRFPAEEVVPALLARTAGPEVPVRKGAVRALASLRAEAAKGRLEEMLGSDPETRGTVLAALAALKCAPAAVRGLLRSPKEPEGVQAAVCLGAAGDGESVAALVDALGDDHPFPVRLAAAEQCAARFEVARPRLRALVLDREGPVVARRNALLVLGRSKAPAAAAEIQECLEDPDPRIRISAFRAAAELSAALAPEEGTRLARALDAARARETDPLVKRLR
jgi:HEAT repeat protein